LDTPSQILVIIPARNEAAHIRSVIKGIWGNISDCDILVVEDGSIDNTVQIVRSSGAKIISLPINLGYGGALRVGFNYALSKGYKYVISMDADGQHDPNDLDAIMRAICEEDNDLVIGSRFLGEVTYSIPIARQIGMVLFSKITSAVVGKRITDTTCGFMGIGPKALPVVASTCPTDFPNAELICTVACRGLKVREVPVRIHKRDNGASMFTLWRSLYYPFKLLLAISMVLLRKNAS
jgi:hypothetical protein